MGLPSSLAIYLKVILIYKFFVGLVPFLKIFFSNY